MTALQGSRARRLGSTLMLSAMTCATLGVAALCLTGTATADEGRTSHASSGGMPSLLSGIYELSGQAVALQSTTNDPAVPFGLPFSIGSYGASSALNSSGSSKSDAGAPYSPLLSSLPSTGNGLLQSSSGYGLPVVPTSPGYVSATDPLTPLARQNAGGYELIATASETEARGRVSLGAQAALSSENNAFALANSIATPERLFTEGAAGVHALTLEGILDIANFSSYASLARGADGRVVPTTETLLGTATFGGITSGLTGRGLKFLGAEPVPLTIEGLGDLNSALEPAGVRLTYLPEVYAYADQSTSTGGPVNPDKDLVRVTSAALQIAFTASAERGTTNETLTLGQVVVGATGSPTGSATAVAGTGTKVGIAGTSTNQPSPGSALDAAAIGGALEVPMGLGASGVVGAGVVQGGITAPSATLLPVGSSTLNPEGRVDMQGLYLVVGVAAAAAFLGGQLLRALTPRRR